MAGDKKGKARALLTTGIPLEMFAYDVLTSSLDADWVEPEYSFTSLNENGQPIQRSIDFVASVNSERSPFSKAHVYFAVECKYAAPDRSMWVFMDDKFPREPRVWDLWRPALWQDKEPSEPPDPAKDFEGRAPLPFPLCARGTFLGQAAEGQDKQEKWEKKPAFDTALHQLRDAVHDLAIERFRLFTKMWSQPECIIFVPILVTNATLLILNDGLLATLEADSNKDAEWADISRQVDRLLVRCPERLDHAAWKSQRFWGRHEGYDLSRVAAGIPMYKRSEHQSLEFHINHFFEQTPAYVTVVSKERLSEVLRETMEWARRLEFHPNHEVDSTTEDSGHSEMEEGITEAARRCHETIDRAERHAQSFVQRLESLRGVFRKGKQDKDS